jgi:hypothetical protein
MGVFTSENRIKLAAERGILYDEDDIDWVKNYTWSVGNHGYAVTSIKIDGQSTGFLMHRVIMDCPEGMVVDHINKNKLDNRKANLRICTQSDNMKMGSIATITSVKYSSKHDVYLAYLNIGTYKSYDEADEENQKVMQILRAANYEFPHERRLRVATQSFD